MYSRLNLLFVKAVESVVVEAVDCGRPIMCSSSSFVEAVICCC